MPLSARSHDDFITTFGSIADGSPLAMAATVGVTHRVCYANPAFCRAIGRAAAELLGHPLAESLPEIHRQGGLALLDRVYGTGAAERAVDLGPVDAGQSNTHGTYTVWPGPGDDHRPAGLIVQVGDGADQGRATRLATDVASEIRDVNQRLLVAGLDAQAQAQTQAALNAALRQQIDSRERAEAALRKQMDAYAALNTALRITGEERDQALADARAALRVRDEFLASISHDLRTPLAAIMGYTQLVLRRAERAPSLDSASVTTLLSDANAATVKMAAMVDELLDLTQLESGRPLDLNRQPVDLADLVRRTTAIDPQGTRGPMFEVATSVAAITGWWDAARLERVVENVVSNAVKYSKGGGIIHISLAIEQTAGDHWAVLRVRDEGLGIPADDLPHIFERFHRGANVVGRIHGVGIGLAGSKQIVEQHGGTIGLVSTEGVGTTVTIRLPLDSPVGHAAPPPAMNSARPRSPGAHFQAR